MSFVTVLPKESSSIPGNQHLVITCEHGGNRIPVRYRGLFKVKKAVLLSHRGYDIGALSLATDGKYLYFTWRQDLGDIWVMDVVQE